MHTDCALAAMRGRYSSRSSSATITVFMSGWISTINTRQTISSTVCNETKNVSTHLYHTLQLAWCRSTPNSNQFLLVTYCTSQKNFIKIHQQLFHYPANRQAGRQADRQTDRQLLGKTYPPRHLQNIAFVHKQLGCHNVKFLNKCKKMMKRFTIKLTDSYRKVHILHPYNTEFVCLFAWGLTALSAQIGYIAP